MRAVRGVITSAAVWNGSVARNMSYFRLISVCVCVPLVL